MVGTNFTVLVSQRNGSASIWIQFEWIFQGKKTSFYLMTKWFVFKGMNECEAFRHAADCRTGTISLVMDVPRSGYAMRQVGVVQEDLSVQQGGVVCRPDGSIFEIRAGDDGIDARHAHQTRFPLETVKTKLQQLRAKVSTVPPESILCRVWTKEIKQLEQGTPKNEL